jgi:hypothetical protein
MMPSSDPRLQLNFARMNAQRRLPERIAEGNPRADSGRVMKELVREGETDYIVPTGDGDAIVQRLLEVCHTLFVLASPRGIEPLFPA